MTGVDHEHSEAVVIAAHWLIKQTDPPKPVIVQLRRRFNLTALEACEASALANRCRIEDRAAV